MIVLKLFFTLNVQTLNQHKVCEWGGVGNQHSVYEWDGVQKRMRENFVVNELYDWKEEMWNK